MAKHNLRVYPGVFRAVKQGLRTLELLEDRGYQVDDELCYQEYDAAEGELTGDQAWVRVTMVGRPPLHGVPRGHVRLSILLFDLPIRVPGNLEEERRRRDARGTGEL